MKKYLVRFNTKGGDYDKEWCYAENERQAAENILNEHWNIKEVTSVTKID